MWPLFSFTISVLAAAAAAAAQPDTLILNAHDVLRTPYVNLSRLSATTSGEQLPSGDVVWSSEVQLTGNGRADFSAWNEATNEACIARLRSVTRTSNPSGTSICYNLAMLDALSGAFTADLRLYRVSGPRGRFVGASRNVFHLAVAYSGATSRPMKEKSDLGGWNEQLTRRADDGPVGGPVMLQSYKLEGQIDRSKLISSLTMADLEALILPNLTLTAKTPSGNPISAPIFPNEASFLLGAFSKVTIMPDWTASQILVDDHLAAVRNGSIPSPMPGRHMMIFPIGLVITSAWLAVGLVFFGFGTYERVRDRYLYRKALTLFARSDEPPGWI